MINNTDRHNKIHIILLIFSLVFIFYKIHFKSSVGILGDELNSILVYSTNIYTLFLKNFPGNVTFFHSIGWVGTKVLGYDLLNFRTITFLLFAGNVYVFYLQFRSINFLYILILLSLSSYLILYTGFYLGYIFSSLLFVLIFYFILKNDDNTKSKIIFFLLFLQLYNHLVNLYLCLPILLYLFIYNEQHFRNNLKYFIVYFCVPLSAFYMLSIILTGLSLAKLPNYSLITAFDYLNNNFFNIFFSGSNRIFFYEAYADAKNFSITILFKNIFFFDKIFLFTIVVLIIFLLINTKTKKIPNKIVFIMWIHFLMFFLINKDPAPRIFNGFFLSYLFVIFIYLSKITLLQKEKISLWIGIFWAIVLYSHIYFFNFNKRLLDTIFVQDTQDNKAIIKDIYLSKCMLNNKNYNEMNKKLYYFNYLNICKQKFNLNKFRKFYKS